MLTMTDLTADNTSQRCQRPTTTIPTPSFNLSVSSALKADTRGTKCIFSTSPTDLREIPTRISQRHPHDAVVNQRDDDDERSPHPTTTSTDTTIADSNRTSLSLPSHEADDELVYKQHLVAIYDIFEQMQQCWPLRVYSTLPTPSTPDAKTATLPLASTMNQAALTTSEPIPSLPCSSAPTTFCERLAAFTDELKCMQHLWPLRAEVPRPMSSPPVPTTLAPLSLVCTQQFTANIPSNATDRNTTTPKTTPEPMCDQPAAPQLLTVPPSTLPCPEQQTIQFVPFTAPITLDNDSNSSAAVPPVPVSIPEQPTPIALECDRLDIGGSLPHSATMKAATTQFTGMPHPITNSLSTITMATLTFPPHPNISITTTKATHTHYLDATASLQDIFPHHLHLLQQIKEKTEILRKLVDRLVSALTTSTPAPHIPLMSSLAELHLTKNLCHAMYPNPTKKSLPRIKMIKTMTTPTVISNCTAMFRTKDHLRPP